MTSYAYRGSDRYDDPSPETCWGKRGTVTGYRRHRDLGERPCDKCAAAWRKYQNRHRKQWLSDPDVRAHDRMMRNARERAKSALAARHAEEYKALVQAEIRRHTSNREGQTS
jgi:hypothetical protein